MHFYKRSTLGILALAAFAAQSVQAADAFFNSAHFSGSGNCATCHNGLFDQASNDVSIESEWSATMMANATRDPLWRAKFATEIERVRKLVADSTGLEEIIEDKCTRCHAPMANEESSYFPGDTRFFNGGFSDPTNPYHDVAMDGVSCTLCHQIADDPALGTPEGESGHYIIEDLANSARPAYGQYANPRINPMQVNSGFTPRHSAHVSDSKLCATCHNLKTPVLEADGDIATIEFPEQAVYTEWENSAFADGAAEASSCQQCHMARAEGTVKIANRPRNLGARSNFARHGFYGGNTLMLDILDANRADLDVGNGDFAASIAATRATLKSAADVAIEQALIEQTADGDQLVVQVRVNNNSGHKLPTSYPSRRVYLHLTVADQKGDLLFESGKLNPNGSIVGVDADEGTGYEPHYDLITSPDQVQVYEPIMGDLDANGEFSGNPTYTLLRAAQYLKDNRILPRGFGDQPTADIGDVAVQGAAADDLDFVAGSDLVTYHIPMGAATGATVAVELNYQSVSFGYLRDLFQDENTVPEVASFHDMYNASSVRAETIATATVQVDVNGGGSQVNQPPTASFTFNCTDLACTFDGATGSYDPDGHIVQYDWDFGDGTTATGAQANHTYAAAGTYTVTLTVTDNEGATGSTTQAVTVTSGRRGRWR